MNTDSATLTKAKNHYMLAASHLKGVLKEQNIPVAIENLQAASELGLVEATYQLGLMNADGAHLPQNFVEAEKWFNAAAEQAFVPAKFALATLYAQVEQHHRSVEILQSLADEGIKEAQTNLANLYLMGVGIEKDTQVAIELLKAAAENGDRLAHYRLGELYYKGQQVVRNPMLARKHTVAAMEQHYLPAYLVMGSLLEHGIGITQDTMRAYCMYYYCHHYGLPNLTILMNDILSNMEPLDAHRATTLAAEFFSAEAKPTA